MSAGARDTGRNAFRQSEPARYVVDELRTSTSASRAQSGIRFMSVDGARRRVIGQIRIAPSRLLRPARNASLDGTTSGGRVGQQIRPTSPSTDRAVAYLKGFGPRPVQTPDAGFADVPKTPSHSASWAYSPRSIPTSRPTPAPSLRSRSRSSSTPSRWRPAPRPTPDGPRCRRGSGRRPSGALGVGGHSAVGAGRRPASSWRWPSG